MVFASEWPPGVAGRSSARGGSRGVGGWRFSDAQPDRRTHSRSADTGTSPASCWPSCVGPDTGVVRSGYARSGMPTSDGRFCSWSPMWRCCRTQSAASPATGCRSGGRWGLAPRKFPGHRGAGNCRAPVSSSRGGGRSSDASGGWRRGSVEVAESRTG